MPQWGKDIVYALINIRKLRVQRKAKGIKTEPLPKSWWTPKENVIKDDDSPEEIRRKKLYMEICASKKPYFFGYNYLGLKKEYDTYRKNDEENSMAMYKMPLDVLLDRYENGQLDDEMAIKFAENHLKYCNLDMSKSTMNRICWAIEDEFDDVDLFRDVYFDYNILKSGKEYDKKTYDSVKLICKSYKPNIKLAVKRAVYEIPSEQEEQYADIDMILHKLIEDLYHQCNDMEMLCDILVDLCYGERFNKQILWSACSDEILNRLLKSHDYQMTYPQKDVNGDFWCQGVRYSMATIIKKEEDEREVQV